MTKEESDEMYIELKKTYTDEEIAESFIWSIDRTPEEDKEFSKLISEHRKKYYADMSWFKRNKTKLYLRYLGIKYKIQDWYKNKKNKYGKSR